jgi:hypothetical protein
MASGNEHVYMGFVVQVEGPDAAIASQKVPQLGRLRARSIAGLFP